jgi:hypothetical protein
MAKEVLTISCRYSVQYCSCGYAMACYGYYKYNYILETMKGSKGKQVERN